MKIAIAILRPHLNGVIAAGFESAPYYLLVDTATGCTITFPHPVQFQSSCSAERLVNHLLRSGAELILAGGFSDGVRAAARALQITLKEAHGRAGDAVVQCPGSNGCCNEGRHRHQCTTSTP